MPFLERKGNIIDSFVSRFLPKIPQTNLSGVAQTGVEVSHQTIFSVESQKDEMTRSCGLRNLSFEEIQAQMLKNIEAYQRKFICERDQQRVLIPSSNLERVGGHYRVTNAQRTVWKERAAEVAAKAKAAEAEKNQAEQSLVQSTEA